MTAETLKPFITPTSAVNNYPAMQSSGNNTSSSQHKRKLFMIAFSIVALAVAGILLGFTMWNSMRVSKLENDLAEQIKVIDSLHKRLGINYLDDFNDFEKQYVNRLIDDPDALDDTDIRDDDQDDNEMSELDRDEHDDQDDGNGEGDDDNDGDGDEDADDDDDDADDTDLAFEELRKKYENYDDDNDQDYDVANVSGDDNLYDDFEKFQDSKKKKPRKSRSIAEVPNEIQTNVVQVQQQQNKTSNDKQKERDDQDRHRFISPPLGQAQRGGVTYRQRTRSPRRYRFPVVKSGESLFSAKSAALINAMTATKPAAHFHLHDAKPDASAGVVYIGHPSAASSEANWQQFFSLDNGVLTVRQPGLYYAYAQICYNNTHDENGFVIYHGHKPFLQCLNTVPTNMPKIHTCHTSGLIYLEENETIHLRDFHTNRNVVLKNASNRSYFGLFKV